MTGCELYWLRFHFVLVLCFMSLNVSAQNSIEIGSDTLGQNITPFPPIYQYGYSQQIFGEELLDFNGTIESISIFNSSQKEWSDSFQIYMAEVPVAYFEEPYDWIDPNSLGLVFDGSVNFPQKGWAEIELDQAFEYGGDSSLIIAFNNTSDSYVQDDYPRFFFTILDEYVTSLSYFSDAVPFDLSDPQDKTLYYIHHNNIIFSGGLHYLIPQEESKNLSSAINSQDSIRINTSLAHWDIHYDESSWLKVETDFSNDQIIVHATQTNNTDKIRSIELSITGDNVDTAKVRVDQLPGTDFIAFKDIFGKFFNSTKDIGDFDNDGDLDLILGGSKFDDYSIYNGIRYDNITQYSGIIELYRNEGNWRFSKVNFFHEVVADALVRFLDVDNDNDLDLFVSGHKQENGGEEPYVCIYENVNNYYFEGSPRGLKQICSSERYYTWHINPVAIEDFNNDGFVDIIQTGTDFKSDPQTSVMLNNKRGEFVEEVADLVGVNQACLSYRDIDDDFDWDIFFSGRDMSTNQVIYYAENRDSGFAEMRLNIPPKMKSSSLIVDLEKDDKLEVIYGGEEGIGIYEIGEDLSSVELLAEFPGNAYPGINTGYLHSLNDGQALLITGKDTSYVIHTDKDSLRLEIDRNIHLLPTADRADQGILGDLDNDGDLDFMSGFSLYQNNMTGIGYSTPVPLGLESEIIDGIAYLKWKPGTIDVDEEYFTYNLFIGTHPDSCNIMSPLADLNTGNRKVSRIGNAGDNHGWLINGLDSGTYYWSVQSINSRYEGSEFAGIKSFTVLPPFENRGLKFQNQRLDIGKWADYDDDGDLDVLYSYGERFLIREWTGEEFEFKSTSIDGIDRLDLIDINHDNLLDLYCGFHGDPYEDKLIIHRQNPDHSFTSLEIALAGGQIYDGPTYFCDMDGNQELELIVNQTAYGSDQSMVCEVVMFRDLLSDNERVPSFNRLIDSLFYACQLSLIDFNLDGLRDVFLTGEVEDRSGYATYLLINKGELEFEPVKLAIHGYMESAMEWGDVNNDGYPDLLISGSLSDNYVETAIYLNNIGESLSAMEGNPQFPALGFSVLKMADINNDGFLDFAYGGSGLLNTCRLYLNRNGAFFEFAENYLPTEWTPSSIDFGDFDGDHDEDLLIFGFEQISTQLAYNVHRNNINIPNQDLLPPINLNASFEGDKTILSWEDDKSGKINETYMANVRIGSVPMGSDIACPLSNIHTGKLLAGGKSNVGFSKRYIINSLPVGTYYWSVQAVDQSNMGGEWSSEHSFRVTELRAAFTTESKCQGESVRFVDESVTISDSIVSWIWDFGDGSHSNQTNPTHTYEDFGSFQVTLKVIGINYTDSITQALEIKPKPLVDFDGTSVCIGEPTEFISKVDDLGTNITSWKWRFGDDQESEDQHPGNHYYAHSGNYSSSLKVIGSNGCSDSLTKEIVVAEYPDATIAANGPVRFCKGGSVILNAKYHPDYLYQWSLDSVPLHDSVYNHCGAVYKGSYTVEVSNKFVGCSTRSDKVTVDVVEQPVTPVIDLTEFDPNNCPESESVILDVADATSLYTYQWKKNGVPIAGANEPTLEGILSEGNYSVEANNFICSSLSEEAGIFYKYKLPEKPEILVKGSNVWYFACSNDSAQRYRWYFEDAMVQESTDPVFVANKSLGTYYVSINMGGNCWTSSDPISIPLTNINWPSEIFRELNIYPNPSTGLVHIELDNSAIGDLIMEVYNENGSMIRRIEMLKKTSYFVDKVDLSDQPKGTYIINLQIDNKMASRQLIVE